MFFCMTIYRDRTGGFKMAERGILQVAKRTNLSNGERNRLRKTGFVPGIIYGKNLASEPVAVRADDLRKAIKDFGRNAVFELDKENDSNDLVLIKEIQFAPIVSNFTHVDFQKVSLSEETKLEVPIKVHNREFLEARRLLLSWQTDLVIMKGLPQDIPESIDIDTSKLNAGDVIKVSDLKVSDNMTIENDPDQIILSISEAKINEEADNEEGTEE